MVGLRTAGFVACLVVVAGGVQPAVAQNKSDPDKVGVLEAQIMGDAEKGAPRDPLRETALRAMTINGYKVSETVYTTSVRDWDGSEYQPTMCATVTQGRDPHRPSIVRQDCPKQ